MPCDEQKDKMEDKKEAFLQASSDVSNAEGTLLTAEIAMGVACIAAVATGGGAAFPPAAGACLVAIAAYEAATEALFSAQDKKDRANNAFNTAKTAYDNCMSKLKPTKS